MKLIVMFMFFVVCQLISGSVFAQTKPAEAGQSKTKLEAFQAKSGVIIIKGFSRMGSVNGRFGGLAEVQSMELRDAGSALRITGAVVTIREGGRLESESRSFIDYDEIDSLIKGLDYVARADSTVTKLSSFEANYSTKGDLMISVYSQQTGELGAAISSGSAGTVRVFFTLDDLSRFRGLLVEARAKLDGIR
jgi:hypothetical protein